MPPQLTYNYTVDDLIKNNIIKRCDVEEIKEWLKQQEELPKITEEQIACFLLSCNNKIKETCVTIKAHYNYKKNLPELFNERNLDTDEDVKVLLNAG